MLKLVSINNSYKKILAHSIIINGKKLNKGKIIEKSDIKLLNNIGKKKIYIFEKTPEHIGENKAAFQISKHIIGKNITINNPVNGRADLFSKINGLLDYDSKLLFKLNFSNDELAVAMMRPLEVVKKNQLIGNVKILPYAMKKKEVKKTLSIKKYLNFIKVKKAKNKNITLIISSDEENLKSNNKVVSSVNSRLLNFDLKLKQVLYCKHNESEIKNILLSKNISNSNLILLYGSTSIVDKNDIIPKALKKAKGKVIAYGAPTDPGNLLMFGTLKNKQVIGVPGCAKSVVRNGFDLILEKACYDFSIDKRVIAELSCGGLFKKIIRKN